MASETFSYTGSLQTWDVPNNVTEATIRCWGAGGAAADSPGETGGYAEATVGVWIPESVREAIPADLQALLEPIASTSVVDSGVEQRLVARTEVRL